VEQIPNVAIICHEAPHLFGDVLRNHLLGIVMKYLSDLDNQASDLCTKCRVLEHVLKAKTEISRRRKYYEMFLLLRYGKWPKAR